MSTFRIRVVSDTEEDCFRDIEIKFEQNFEELHNAIVKAFELNEGEMASFYTSNENWDKGEEIALMEMPVDPGEVPVRVMKTTNIKDVIKEKGQKLVFVYDFLNMWCFYLDVIEINPDSDDDYPRIVKVFGKLPKLRSVMDEMPDIEGLDLDDTDDDDPFDGFDDFKDLRFN